MWVDEVEKELKRIYGPVNGGFVAHTIIPSFYMDYRRMLAKASIGDIVEETYQTEDKKAVIGMKARIEKGSKGPEHRLISVTVNGKAVAVNAGEKLP